MTPPLTLSRYLSARAVTAVGGLFAILVALVLLIDLIENMRFAGKFADGDFGLAVMMTLLRAPSLTQALIPFVFLFGSIWMFHQLNRRSELSVMRSAGLSVWRLLAPAGIIAALSGLLLIGLVDPMSSRMLAQAETIKARAEGADRALVQLFDDGIWLRQRTETSQLIINAESLDRARGALTGVTVWRFGAESAFLERIDADEALLSGRTMELYNALLKSPGDREARRAPLYAVDTTLTSKNLRERVAPPETLSLWRLPRFIDLAETAGLPTVRYQIRFHDLCSTPLKLIAMVLIAAAFSMRPTRSGGQLQLALMSIGAGFALYILSEVSTAFGESELAPIALAAWTPAIAALLIAASALLHLEDG